MKKTILLLAFTVFATLKLVAQSTEKPLIEATIQLYFDGWMDGDTTKLGKAMHTTCHLKYYRDNKFVAINRKDYLNIFKPHVKEIGAEGRIKMLDITNNIASAKCEIDTPKSLYTDYFNLIKIDGFWYIVDKISTRVNK